MITLVRISDGKIKTMSERSYQVLKGKVAGYKLKEEVRPEKKIFQKKEEVKEVKEVEPEPIKEKEITREEMMEYLKGVGLKPHPNIGDDKLKKRYELELETQKS